MKDEIISLREFARRMTVSDKTIRDAINLGKIKKGVIVDGDKKKINYQLAKIEAEECNLGAKARYGKDQPEEKIKKSNQKNSEEHDLEISDDMTMAEAQKKEKIAKARLAQLEYKEKTGVLVRSDEIYKELFEYGKEVRTNILSLPERITDQLISMANDRQAFINTLTDNLINSLEVLSKFDKK